MKHLLLAFLVSTLSLHGQSPALEAVRQSDHSRLQSLIEAQRDLNAADANGMTALHQAALQDDLKGVRMLLEGKANPSVMTDYGITPLWLACQNGNASIVRTLLKAGAAVDQMFHGKQSALMMAARAGSLESVQALANQGAELNTRESRGQTAIMWASAEGHADVVTWLIEAGADFRSPLKSGFTPLFFAIREGRHEVVQTLIEAGIDIQEAMDPERRASRGPQSGMTPLLMAVENGHFELAIELVKAGADPDDLRPGYAALHAITWVRKPDSGEGVNGLPPPDGSGNLTSLEFVKNILSLGADVNIRIPNGHGGAGKFSRQGATPFLMAAKTADLNLLKLLHQSGADSTILNEDEVTPLIAAAGLGTVAAGEVAGTEEEVMETVHWLLEKGMDINAVSTKGETVMHAAAYKNLPRVIEFMAGHGADIEVWNKANQHGWTPLLIAEGFRPGNFKPSFETIASIHEVMLAAGIAPPPPTQPKGINNTDYTSPEQKKADAELWKKDNQ